MIVNLRKVALVALIALLTISAVGVVSAQGRGRGADPAPRGPSSSSCEMMNIVAEEIGLTAEEILQQLRAGASLAEVVASQGGDMDAVIARLGSAQGIFEGLWTRTQARLRGAAESGQISRGNADRVMERLNLRLRDPENCWRLQEDV
jgi:hypothetical protein